MNTDIRIETTFKGHRKRRHLNKILGCEATGHLLDLWITVAQERPSGVLTKWDVEDIALAAGWEGEAQKFIDALLQAKLLDVNGDKVFSLHDWEEHQPWVCGTTDRREAARKAGIASAIKRANKSNNKAKINAKSTEVNGSLKTVDKAFNGLSTDGQPRTHTVPIPIPYQDLTNTLPNKNNIYGEFHNVSLSEEEFRKLKDKFGEVKAGELIENLSQGIASKGYKYKSHYAAILAWERRSKKQELRTVPKTRTQTRPICQTNEDIERTLKERERRRTFNSGLNSEESRARTLSP